ncbi:hypothetical protein GF354_03210 [Candidatus Peregrinibacteria bacterium]|nr:hypothetical protein [Candidatus Peregrinibacteria bacterium]
MFLLDLLILLSFVWIFRKLFHAIKLPPLFGEIFAGVMAGPIILGLVHETEAMKILAELGIFFLMFHSGLESEPEDIFKNSKNAIFVTFSNLILTVLGSILLGWIFNLDTRTTIFLSLILSVTAVTIATRVFKDAKISRSKVANTVKASAVMTEVLILAAFSIFLDLGKPEAVFDLKSLLFDLLKFASYFAVVFYVGHHYFKYLYRFFYKGNKGFTFSVIIALTLGVIAEAIGLHFIIGAFLAGLFLHQELFEESVFKKIEDRTFGISYSFLAPIFFATLAFHLNFSAIFVAPIFAISVLLVVIAAKIIGSGLAAHFRGLSKYEALGIGLGMNSRGAVDLIIASIALQTNLISQEIFSILVFVSFISTFISIMGIKIIGEKLKKNPLKKETS